MDGVIVGAPHGTAEPVAADYARWISEQTGAALVIGYGFGAKRLSVARPLVRFVSHSSTSDGPLQRGSVYSEYKELLRQAANGRLRFYVGVRSESKNNNGNQIRAITGGLSFEEIEKLKDSFTRIRNRLLNDRPLPEISLAMEPFEQMSAPLSGIKHHGVLLVAEKGLSLTLPTILSNGEIRSAYKEVLSSWIAESVKLVKEHPHQLPNIRVKVLADGRIESLPSRNERKGVVIAAPHGTFDEHTAELVKLVSHRTGIAAVVALGFSPTECGGWRINVNRPTERLYPSGEIEISSKRAQNVYASFRQAVLEASQQNLDLYIDIHQNGRRASIEVATVGITKPEAALIKYNYEKIRHQVLKRFPGVAPVDLLIEPLDEIEIGAWAAKAQGILAVAARSLHVELPLYDTLGSANARQAYADILTFLLRETTSVLSAPRRGALAM
jgi:hypothetical protein